MRVCIDKSTGKLIEMQSDATEGTLIQNAINAGFEAEIEEKEVTEAEWQAILAAQPVLDRTITDEEQRITDLELAIASILGGA